MTQVINALTYLDPAASSNSTDPSTREANITQYVTLLRSLGQELRDAVLGDPASHLAVLDPSTNSIGYLHVLQILLAAINPPPPTPPSSSLDRKAVLDATTEFLLNFDRLQIRHVGLLYLVVLEHVASGRLFSPLVTVELLTNALLRNDPSGSMFTSVHLALVTFAYEKDFVEPLLKLIDLDITSYPAPARHQDPKPLFDPDLPPSVYISTSSGMTRDIKASTVLEYNMVCGQIYMARRDWPKASKAFERVVTHPVKDRGVSKIMAECYKKWLLSSKTAYANLSATYSNIAQLFSSPDAAQLKADVESNRSVWEEDRNEYLIAEVIAAYQKWQIINMRDVYSQISVSQILSATSSAQTGEPLKGEAQVISLVEGMIESGMLRGELKDGYLTFLPDQDILTEKDFAREIARSHHAISVLGKEYHHANERLSANKDYVTHVVREQKHSDRDGDNQIGDFESQIEDEDLMAEIIANG